MVCHSRETGCCRIVIIGKNVMLNLSQHLKKSMKDASGNTVGNDVSEKVFTIMP